MHTPLHVSHHILLYSHSFCVLQLCWPCHIAWVGAAPTGNRKRSGSHADSEEPLSKKTKKSKYRYSITHLICHDSFSVASAAQEPKKRVMAGMFKDALRFIYSTFDEDDDNDKRSGSHAESEEPLSKKTKKSKYWYSITHLICHDSFSIASAAQEPKKHVMAGML